MMTPSAGVPKIRGFSFTQNPQGDVNEHPVMYAYGSFNRAQSFDGANPSGSAVNCGCVAQIENYILNLLQITDNPPYVGNTGVGLNAGDTTLAIVNDMVVYPTDLLFLLVGNFTNYVYTDGTVNLGPPTLKNITTLSPPPLNYGGGGSQIIQVGWNAHVVDQEFGTNGEIYGALYDANYTTYVVGDFTTAGFDNTLPANGYAKFVYTDYNTPQTISTTSLPLGSVMRGISVSGTDPVNQLIYGGTTSTTGAFAYSVVSADGTNTQLSLTTLPTNYVGGLNGLAYGPIPGLTGSYDVLGLFDPTTTSSPMKFWCSNGGPWNPLSYNPANNGDTPTTNATGQGLLYNGTTLYMNGANNSTGNTYFKYLA